ncbi:MULTISPECIES: thioesterase family protein [unclassified Minwuia]|jgi:4-hydroxybenzoyl-CoA thioesterase|uniref:acyl-CoA thioesterase n=1 Tax=unclassified Minwuia TaxID=2618799 RepID=UPI00247ACBB8|nr:MULTISPECIES: thioesterase family protein [unclassified Minwuia]
MLHATQRIRVEWGHCDPARIIFNPNYYIWMDQGTHGLLEAAGFPFAKLTATPDFRGCPLVASGMDFRSPAFYSDVLLLTTFVERFGTKSFTVRHHFTRDGDLLAEGHEVRVWAVNVPDDPRGMKAIPVPADVRAMLEQEGSIDVTA